MCFALNQLVKKHSQKPYLKTCGWSFVACGRVYTSIQWCMSYNWEKGFIDLYNFFFLFLRFVPVNYSHHMPLSSFLSLSLSTPTSPSGTFITYSARPEYKTISSPTASAGLLRELPAAMDKEPRSVPHSLPLQPTDGGTWPAPHSRVAIPRMVGRASTYDWGPVLPSRCESTNWQWSSPLPQLSPML